MMRTAICTFQAAAVCAPQRGSRPAAAVNVHVGAQRQQPSADAFFNESSRAGECYESCGVHRMVRPEPLIELRRYTHR